MRRIDVRPGFAAFVLALAYFDTAGLFFPYFSAAALHEGGHLLALWALHGQLQRITLGFGDVQIRTAPLPPNAEALCALAGPAVNLLCAGLFLRSLPAFAGVSLALGAFNLLPVWPLDGGRLLRLALRQTRTARTWELLVGLLCCAALLGLGVWAAGRLQTGLWVLLPALLPAARLIWQGKTVAFPAENGYNNKINGLYAERPG